MLTYLIITPNHDQPLDFMDDKDEYVCDLNISEDEVLESLDDAIMARYREIWS
jgi:hypothetical protein